LLFIMTAAFVVTLASPARAVTTVGLWHMDETSGTIAIDSSGHGNNGTLTNVAFVSPGYNGTGGAYSFNGTSSKVIVRNSASLNPGGQDISITVHVNFTVLPGSVGDYDIVRKAGPTSYKIEIAGTCQAACYFKGSTLGKLIFGPALNNGSWHTITCTKSSSSITGIVDGQSTSRSVTVGSISSGTKLVFGAKNMTTGDMYNGRMDEVSIAIG
jgi:hypothetical protein